MRYVIILVILLSTFSSAQKPQTADNTHHTYNESTLLSSLKKMGEGQMKILFWKVYKAEFYTSNVTYNEELYPKALKLTYQRNIEKKEFIDATKDQWVKLNKHYNPRIIAETQEDKWLTQLQDIFPNINNKDIILFVLNKKQEAHFYLKIFDKETNQYNKAYQKIGAIVDPLFGDYFLSIWLSEHTSEPKLRKQLIRQ